MLKIFVQVLISLVLLHTAQCRVLPDDGLNSNVHEEGDSGALRVRKSLRASFRRLTQRRPLTSRASSRRQLVRQTLQNDAPSNDISSRLNEIEENFRKLSSLSYHQTTIQQHLNGVMEEIRHRVNTSIDELAMKFKNQTTMLEEVLEEIYFELDGFEAFKEKVDRLTDVEDQLGEIVGKTQVMSNRLEFLFNKTTNLSDTVNNLREHTENSNDENDNSDNISRETFLSLQRRVMKLERQLNNTAPSGGQSDINECSVVSALGMADGRIPNSAITGSNAYSAYNGAHNARLNRSIGWFTNLRTTTSYGTNPENLDWLLVDLGEIHLITGVATQGANEHGSYRVWVTKYKLSFSTDGEARRCFKEGNIEEINGNSDDVTVMRHDLDTPVRARYVMFEPLAFDCDDFYRPTCYLGMRVEIYGCK